MKSMCYVITSLSVGGAQKALLNLANSTLSQTYAPQVISLVMVPGIQQQFVEANIPLLELGINQPKQWWRLPKQLWRVLRDPKPDVIHGWMHHGNLLATLLWFLAGCRPTLLWGMHHTPEKATTERWQHALVLKLGAWLSRFPQAILYVSQRSLERHRELGYAPQKARVMVNGIAQQTLHYSLEQQQQIKQHLGIPAQQSVIGSFTRFVPEKDIPNLLEAIQVFLKHHPDVTFILAGEGMERSNSALQALMTAHDLSAEQVKLLGVQKNIKPLLSILTLATLSSCREALPLFLVEAMAAGVPCVATDVGDVAICIGQTGAVVPKQNPHRLAAAWARLLALPAVQRQQLGQCAQERVQQQYSLEAVVEDYLQLLVPPLTETLSVTEAS